LTAWFVSTTRRIGDDVEWMLTSCATEGEAKALAEKALMRGLRVEAGTVPGVEPRARIGSRAARPWTQASKEGSIMDLRRRLAEFAA
jgi:hypothetical protein